MKKYKLGQLVMNEEEQIGMITDIVSRPLYDEEKDYRVDWTPKPNIKNITYSFHDKKQIRHMVNNLEYYKIFKC